MYKRKLSSSAGQLTLYDCQKKNRTAEGSSSSARLTDQRNTKEESILGLV